MEMAAPMSQKEKDAELLKPWGDEGGVLRVYEFDNEKRAEFFTKKAQQDYWRILAVPYFWPFLPCLFCGYAYIEHNVTDALKAESLALTRDGIVVRVATHDTGCGFEFQRAQPHSKLIPYMSIQDVQLVEPAGGEGCICCLIPRTLTNVSIQTSADGGSARPELSVAGLVDPQGFRNAVLALKRGEGLPDADGPGSIDVPQVVGGDGATGMMGSALGGIGGGSSAIGVPLGASGVAAHGALSGGTQGEIVSILREHTELLRAIHTALAANNNDK